MKYSKQNKIFEIGQEIYPTDMSSLHCKDGVDYVQFDDTEVRNKLRDGHPFVVLSEPYEKRDIGWWEQEYYIDVKFQDSDIVYCIFNSDCNVFKDYWKQLEFIEDCEQCAAFGY